VASESIGYKSAREGGVRLPPHRDDGALDAAVEHFLLVLLMTSSATKMKPLKPREPHELFILNNRLRTLCDAKLHHVASSGSIWKVPLT